MRKVGTNIVAIIHNSWKRYRKNEEIINRVIADLNLPDDVVDALHGEQQGLTELAYRLGWAKTYMKKFGILDNSECGLWSITPDYKTGL